MPGRTQYPTGENLESFLLQAGFSATTLATLDLELWALAGWQAFNKNANRTMLGVTQTREFDPRRVTPLGVLPLRADLLAVTSAAFGSTALTQGTDFRLRRLNAADDGEAYDALDFGLWRRFWASAFPLTTLITITGTWGYGTTIPEDAFVGMMAAAALELAANLIQLRTRGMESWSEADMTERYGPKPMETLMLGWQGMVQRTAGGWNEKGEFKMGRYTRPAMG